MNGEKGKKLQRQSQIPMEVETKLFTKNQIIQLLKTGEQMKKIDIKSLIIGALLATAIFLGVIFISRVMAAGA